MAEQRLIDANALIDKYGDWYTEEGTEEGFIGTLKSLIDKQPTIEPERKTGKWLLSGDELFPFECDQCSETNERTTPWCPHCGCKMEGEQP